MARILSNSCTTWIDFLFYIELGNFATTFSDVMLNSDEHDLSQGACSSLRLKDGYGPGKGA